MDVIPSLLDILSLSGSVNVRAGPMQMLSDIEKDRVTGISDVSMTSKHV
jgi:hypothetical protein